MFNIQSQPDFAERLLLALNSGRTSGRLNETSQFSRVLAELGFLPDTYSKAGWLRYLNNYVAPTKGRDFDRYAKPVLVQALVAMLQDDCGPIGTVIDDMHAAIKVAKQTRSKHRATQANSLYLQQNSSPHTSRSISFNAEVEDALSLLERAAASNNLLGAHRMRVKRIADKLR